MATCPECHGAKTCLGPDDFDMWDCPTCKGTGQVDDTKKPASENDEQTIQTVTNYEVGYKQGVADAMKLFDEEMSETGDVRNARQAMKTLLRFGPQRAA